MDAALITQLKILKMNETKPNFSELARIYDVDRRTVKKYYDGYSGKPANHNKTSKLDEHETLIRKIIVWNDDHTRKIGEIHEEDREIWLTTMDAYISIKEFRPYVQMPSSFILPAAQWLGNTIVDKDTRQIVASFQGDAVVAAAAFVCLTYEVLMYNKYYKYFHEWTK